MLDEKTYYELKKSLFEMVSITFVTKEVDSENLVIIQELELD